MKGQAAIKKTSFSAPIEIKDFNGPQNARHFVGRHLKGQAAIEYLTTYGWAMLLLVIVMGVLISSFSPSFLISEQCNIDSNNLPCYAQMYNEDDDFVVAFKMSNGFGYPIKITDGDIKVTNKDGEEAHVEFKPPLLQDEIGAGDPIIVYATFLGENKAINQLITVNVEVNYTSCAQEINPECKDPNMNKHTKSGKIIGKVTD